MRRALGYVRFKGEWLSKEEARRRRQTLKAVHLEEQGAVLDEEGFWIHEDQIKWKKSTKSSWGVMSICKAKSFTSHKSINNS